MKTILNLYILHQNLLQELSFLFESLYFFQLVREELLTPELFHLISYEVLTEVLLKNKQILRGKICLKENEEQEETHYSGIVL